MKRKVVDTTAEIVETQQLPESDVTKQWDPPRVG